MIFYKKISIIKIDIKIMDLRKLSLSLSKVSIDVHQTNKKNEDPTWQ